MSWSARQSSPNIFAWKWPTWGLTASFRADGVGRVGVGGVEGLEEDRDDSDENSPSFLLVLTAAAQVVPTNEKTESMSLLSIF